MYSEVITPDRLVLTSTPFPQFYAMVAAALLCFVLIFTLPSPYGVMAGFAAAGFAWGAYASLRWITLTLDAKAGQGTHYTRLPDRVEEFSFPMRLVSSAEMQAKDVRDYDPLPQEEDRYKWPGYRQIHRPALILRDGRAFLLPQRGWGIAGAEEVTRKLRAWLSSLPPQA